MGIYVRADSSDWWMALERDGQRPLRRSTGIPLDGGSLAATEALKLDAQRVYAVAKAQLTLGVIEPAKKPIISFADFAAWYLSHIVAHRRGATRDRSIVKQLLAHFDHYASLTEIDAHQVRTWMSERKKAGKAPGTVNRELDVLKAMLHAAVPKYLDHSPLGEVRRFRVPESEPRVLTHDEEARLLEHATDEEAALLIMAIDTLLRLSSCVNVKWAQVKPTYIVPLNAKVSHDTAPITRRLRDALDKLDRDGEYVFASFHRGKGPTAAKNAAIRAFDALCQKARIAHGRAAHGLTFHCLRHTGATRALQRGASVRTVMKLGGWKGERMVMRYTHVTDADVRAAAESIGGKRVLKIAGRK